MSWDVQAVRRRFPQLNAQVRGRPLIYLDNAATSLKPDSVIRTVTEYYSGAVANIHRGAHFFGDLGTTRFEEARVKVQEYLGAGKPEEIVFTRGTTESINLLAYSLADRLEAGDEILLTEMEHHSNIVPWQIATRGKQVKIQAVRVNSRGELDLEDFSRKVSSKTKIFSFVHASNVLGTVNPAKELIRQARDAGALTVLDAAQSVIQGPLDVQDLECDFLAFSGHKVFAPTGIGILYGRLDLLEGLLPFQGGGSMIANVRFSGTEFLAPPHRFEAGTQNISGVLGLGAAIDFMQQVSWKEAIEHKKNLLTYAKQGLAEISGVEFIGNSSTQAAILSFNLSGAHHSDIGQLLDQQGIAVRTGHHCCQPLMERMGTAGTVRVSFSIYNTFEEVELLVKAVRKAKEILS